VVDTLDTKSGLASCTSYAAGEAKVRKSQLDVPSDFFAGASELTLVVGSLRQGSVKSDFMPSYVFRELSSLESKRRFPIDPSTGSSTRVTSPASTWSPISDLWTFCLRRSYPRWTRGSVPPTIGTMSVASSTATSADLTC
jgi:hypothetical protein